MVWPFALALKPASAAHAEVATWARQRGHVFKRVGEDDGFVVEGGRSPLAWRLEWGPSRRRYISGQELRLRLEPRLPPQVQALVMSRPAMVELERKVFAEYMDSAQTHEDDALPQEMRWLAMLAKVTAQPWFAPLRVPYGGVTNMADWMGRWLGGRATPALLQRLGGAVPPAEPFIVSVHQGRITMRQSQPEATPAALEAARLLGELLAFEALRASDLA